MLAARTRTLQTTRAVPSRRHCVVVSAKLRGKDAYVAPDQFTKKRGKNSAVPVDKAVKKSKISDTTGRPQTGRSWDLYLLIVAVIGIVITSIVNVANVKPALDQTAAADTIREAQTELADQKQQRVLGPQGETSEEKALEKAIMKQ